MSKASQKDDIVICPVCNNIYDKPMLLGCRHTVCGKCIGWSGNSLYKFVCPVCGRSDKDAVRDHCKYALVDMYNKHTSLTLHVGRASMNQHTNRSNHVGTTSMQDHGNTQDEVGTTSMQDHGNAQDEVDRTSMQDHGNTPDEVCTTSMQDHGNTQDEVCTTSMQDHGNAQDEVCRKSMQENGNTPDEVGRKSMQENGNTPDEVGTTSMQDHGNAQDEVCTTSMQDHGNAQDEVGRKSMQEHGNAQDEADRTSMQQHGNMTYVVGRTNMQEHKNIPDEVNRTSIPLQQHENIQNDVGRRLTWMKQHTNRSRSDEVGTTSMLQHRNRPGEVRQTSVHQDENTPDEDDRTGMHQHGNRPDEVGRTSMQQPIARPDVVDRTSVQQDGNKPNDEVGRKSVECRDRPDYVGKTNIQQHGNTQDEIGRTLSWMKRHGNRPNEEGRTIIQQNGDRPDDVGRICMQQPMDRPNEVGRTTMQRDGHTADDICRTNNQQNGNTQDEDGRISIQQDRTSPDVGRSNIQQHGNTQDEIGRMLTSVQQPIARPNEVGRTSMQQDGNTPDEVGRISIQRDGNTPDEIGRRNMQQPTDRPDVVDKTSIQQYGNRPVDGNRSSMHQYENRPDEVARKSVPQDGNRPDKQQALLLKRSINAETSPSVDTNKNSGPLKCQSCVIQSKPVNWLCDQCSQVYCKECKDVHDTIPTCKSHYVKSIEVAAHDIRSQYNQYQSILGNSQTQVLSYLENFFKYRNQIERSAEEAVASIDDHENLCVNNIQEQHQLLRDSVLQAKGVMKQQLDKEETHLQSIAGKIKGNKDGCIKLEHTQDNAIVVHVYTQRGSDVRNFVDNLGESIPIDIHPPFLEVKIEKRDQLDIKDSISVKPVVKNIDVMYNEKEIVENIQNSNNMVEYTDVLKYIYKPEKSISLQYSPRRLHLRDDHIWCAGTAAIYIYNKDGTLVKTIAHDNWKQIKSMTFTESGHMIVACWDGKGLWGLEDNGKSMSNLLEGSFSDVVSRGNILYALSYVDTKVYQLMWSKDGKWIVDKEIKLHYNSGNNWDSIYAHVNTIYVCSWTNNCIYHYNLMGQVLSQYGNQANVTLGYFNHPRICGADYLGNILVVDTDNHKIKVQDNSGNWGYVTHTADIRRPIDAVVDGCTGDLWLIQNIPGQTHRLHKLVRRDIQMNQNTMDAP